MDRLIRRGLLLLAALLASACAPSRLPELAQPLRPETGRRVAGLIGPAETQGPDLWLGGESSSRLLAVDASGRRALLTDGERVALYDATPRQITHLLPTSGHLVHRGVFAAGGGAALLVERESELNPALEHLRLVDLPTRRTLATLPLPCGCLVALGASATRLEVAVSSEALGGTWALAWTLEGAPLPPRRLTAQVVRLGRDGVAFSQRGDRLVGIFQGEDGAAEVRWLELEGEDATPRILKLGAPPEARCVEEPSPCAASGFIEPSGEAVWWAQADASARLEVRRLLLDSAHQPTMTYMASGLRPEGWSLAPDGAPLLLATRRLPGLPDEAQPPVVLLRPEAGALEERYAPPQGALPLPGPLAFEPEQVGAGLLGAWREALGLAVDTRARLGAANAPALAVDDATGVVVLTSLRGGWRLPPDGEPTPLPALPAAPLRAFEADLPLEVRRLLGLVSPLLLTLHPAAPPPGWTGGLGPLYTWAPPAGLLLDVLPTGREPGELVALTGGGGAASRALLLKPPLTPTESWLAQRPLWPAAGTLHLALLTTSEPAHAPLFAARVAADPPRLEIQPLDPATLDALPPRSYPLAAPPEGVAATPRLPTLATWTRERVALLDLLPASGRAPQVAWTPGEGAWVRHALPLASRRVLVRLAHPERPSAEHWLWLDLEDPERPRVLGHRRLHDVLAVAAWPARQQVLALDARGVLTRFAWDDAAGVSALEVTLLSPQDGAWLTLDAQGHLRLPRGAAARAVVAGWLQSGLVQALEVDQHELRMD